MVKNEPSLREVLVFRDTGDAKMPRQRRGLFARRAAGRLTCRARTPGVDASSLQCKRQDRRFRPTGGISPKGYSALSSAGAGPRLLHAVVEQGGRQAVALRRRVLQKLAESVGHLFQRRMLGLAESHDTLDGEVDLGVVIRHVLAEIPHAVDRGGCVKCLNFQYRTARRWAAMSYIPPA
jgi:hypothetical protein